MREETKIRLRERKSQPRKSMFRPAKTEKGKWLRFYCCLVAVGIVLIIAFFGKYFAPYDPLATDYAAKLSAPAVICLVQTMSEEMFSQEYCTGPAIPLC